MYTGVGLSALQIYNWLNAVNQVLLSFLSDTLCLSLTFLGTVLLHTAPWHECLATKFTFPCWFYTLWYCFVLHSL